MFKKGDMVELDFNNERNHAQDEVVKNLLSKGNRWKIRELDDNFLRFTEFFGGFYKERFKLVKKRTIKYGRP